MNPKHRIAFLMAVAFLCSGRVYAHDSFAATYYIDRSQTIEGNIVECLYRNPHSYIKVEAPDEKRQMQTEFAFKASTAHRMVGNGVAWSARPRLRTCGANEQRRGT